MGKGATLTSTRRSGGHEMDVLSHTFHSYCGKPVEVESGEKDRYGKVKKAGYEFVPRTASYSLRPDFVKNVMSI
jgi:hypothetical protein